MTKEKPGSEPMNCSSYLVHPERVAAAQAASIDPALLAELGELFKLFSDATRLRILSALALGELCVCDIEAVLEMSQSAVSHQLAMLRTARLVSARRDGKTVFYSLADDHVGTLLKMGLEHASERAAGLPVERAAKRVEEAK